MRKDLVDKAEAAAKAEAAGDGLPGLRPVGPEGNLRALPVTRAFDTTKSCPNPWMVGGGQGRRYIARVATLAEGAAVAAAYEAAGDKLLRVSPKAMRATVKRMARQVIEGQLPLPLGDGFDGCKPEGDGDD